MNIKLTRFKVINFRSIERSDWIDVADNSCLVGTNEAGKTNLLIALWKLRPANREPIVPLDDFPRHLYSNYSANNHSQDVFIEADFQLDDDYSESISKTLHCDPVQVNTVLVKRRYDGKYLTSFPYSKIDSYPKDKLEKLIILFKQIVNSNEAYIKANSDIKDLVDNFISDLSETIATGQNFNREEISELIKSAENFIQESLGKKKNLPSLINEHLVKTLNKIIDSFDGKPIAITEEIRKDILKNLPNFVYYSDYGNLDSEIYLPRVIEDFKRQDLSEAARAKVRTLEVLFKYVNLSPEDIYELGDDTKTIIQKVNQHHQVIDEEEVELSEEEIQAWSDKKRERGILLRSAASELTQRFKKWWLQGDYIFKFEADGRHFRINVSDSLRPEEIELEGRSRGLQWFFSFFLVFLVETKEGHSNSILLLDEPGLSLHPLAQFDLAKFFRKLSEDNQLIYTSHSPFLIDMDNLSNVKAVYVDTDTGRTEVSSNLRHNVKDSEKSIFPIHAAIGLTVSETLLLGCLPVLVEGPSDQIYLSLIKRYLIGQGKLKYSKEIVFIPTGGIRGMSPITKLVSSRDEDLPHVLLDSDKQGTEYQTKLKNGRYKDSKTKVHGISDFLGEGDFEIEDLIPASSLIQIIDREYRCDEYFEDVHDDKFPIVDQIEKWAKDNDIELNPGWKVDLARNIHNRFDKVTHEAEKSQHLVEAWIEIFKKITD